MFIKEQSQTRVSNSTPANEEGKESCLLQRSRQFGLKNPTKKKKIKQTKNPKQKNPEKTNNMPPKKLPKTKKTAQHQADSDCQKVSKTQELIPLSQH